MRKKFVSNLVLVLILNVIIKPFYILGIDAQVLKVTEQNDPGSYGSYFSLLSLSFVFNILLDMGVNTFNTKNIAQNTQLFKKHFSRILPLKIFLGVIYLLVIMLVGIIFSYEVNELKWLILIGINQILIAFILFFRSNLSALLMLRQDSIISVIDRTLLILFCSYFLWAKSTQHFISIEFFIIAQTLAYLLTSLIAFYLLIKKSGRIKIKWDTAFSFAIIKKSLPYALLIFLMSIYYYSDVVMTERLMGSIEASAYAHGYRFFMAFNMIGVLFAGLLLPIFSKMIKQKSDLSKIIWLSFKLMFLFAIIIGVSVWPNRTEIIKWRYELSGFSLIHSSNTFGWLILSFIAVSFNYIFGTLLTANGNLKPMNILATFAVLVNITSNLILIPKYGSTGAAFSSMITQFLTLIFQIYLCFKFFSFKVQRSSNLRLLSFIVLFIMSTWLIDTNLDFIWILKILTYGSIGIVIGFGLKLIEIKELKAFIKMAKN
jgi:O-antigen/teichoic acid export membrane protein